MNTFEDTAGLRAFVLLSGGASSSADIIRALRAHEAHGEGAVRAGIIAPAWKWRFTQLQSLELQEVLWWATSESVNPFSHQRLALSEEVQETLNLKGSGRWNASDGGGQYRQLLELAIKWACLCAQAEMTGDEFSPCHNYARWESLILQRVLPAWLSKMERQAERYPRYLLLGAKFDRAKNGFVLPRGGEDEGKLNNSPIGEGARRVVMVLDYLAAENQQSGNTMEEEVARLWDRARVLGYGPKEYQDPQSSWGSWGRSVQLSQEEKGSIFYYLERLGFWGGFPSPEEIYPSTTLA